MLFALLPLQMMGMFQLNLFLLSMQKPIVSKQPFEKTFFGLIAYPAGNFNSTKILAEDDEELNIEKIEDILYYPLRTLPYEWHIKEKTITINPITLSALISYWKGLSELISYWKGNASESFKYLIKSYTTIHRINDFLQSLKISENKISFNFCMKKLEDYQDAHKGNFENSHRENFKNNKLIIDELLNNLDFFKDFLKPKQALFADGSDAFQDKDFQTMLACMHENSIDIDLEKLKQVSARNLEDLRIFQTYLKHLVYFEENQAFLEKAFGVVSIPRSDLLTARKNLASFLFQNFKNRSVVGACLVKQRKQNTEILFKIVFLSNYALYTQVHADLFKEFVD